ncbi:MAG: mechanosensitive ion channel family protein [Methanomassiliicoccaceae archaeon]|nr:mechanosensitive ion channel family protein [Methanomassiliicoccaceae archaeon]
MRNMKAALMFVAVLVSLLAMAPMLSDSAEAAGVTANASDVQFSLSATSVTATDLYAGRSIDVYVIVSNNHPTDARIAEFMGAGDGFKDKGHIEMPRVGDDGPILLESGETHTLHLKIVADRYLGSMRNVDILLMFAAYDPAAGYDPDDPGERCTLTKTVNIFSGRASENQFNKVMGLFHNPLPGPFDTAIYAAAMTLLVWMIISVFVTYVLLPRIVMPFLIRDSREERKATEGKIQKPMFFMFLLYGATACVAVMGAGEYVVSTVETAAWIIYIIFGAWIFLRILIALLEMWDRRVAADEDEPDDSLTPLFLMLGKIVIAMVATGAILAVLGSDMMIIATGAGIIGLAISFGAQSTLAQFFSGFTLLINRPFRPGDMVRLDSSPDTLKVLNVGFMMTTFRNWANSEIFTMPNQKVVSSTIVNITAESLTYRIIVLVNVPYTSNVMLAKKLALEAMIEHPRILQDGSEEIPKARFENFSESALTIRVSGFVDDFDDHRSIAGEIREGIYTKFLDNGITIAIPKMDVYIKNPSGEESKMDL